MTRTRTGIYFVLLWLAANCLRVTILSVPPVISLIHRDLHLDETMVGALTTLPVLLLAAAAIPGSALIARLGARRALVSGLTLVGLAGAARGLGSSSLVLFLMTFLMGVGIAVSQPSLPSLVREWLQSRAALATATYSNGFLVGEIVAAAFTAPLILLLLGGSWQLALAFWSVPVVLTACATLLLTPHAAKEAGAPAVRWWPDWHSRRTWSLGLVLGCASLAYFCANAFIPDYLKAIHHSGLITATLTSLNLGQLPSSLVVALLSWRVIGRRWPIALAGLLIIGMPLAFALYAPWIVLWAAGLGFATSLVFVLSLALPPILAEEGDVHRLSAAMFTISYTCPLIGSVVGGAAWDATGVVFAPFIPIIVSGFVMIGLVYALHLPLSSHAPAESGRTAATGSPPRAAGS